MGVPKHKRSRWQCKRRKLIYFLDHYKLLYTNRMEAFERRLQIAPQIFPEYSQPAFRSPGFFSPQTFIKKEFTSVNFFEKFKYFSPKIKKLLK